jgi:hypothetical protein
VLVFQNHSHRALPHFGGIPLAFLVHDSILSRIGVSGNPGAVQRNDIWMPGDELLLANVLAGKLSEVQIAESLCDARRMQVKLR